MRKHVSILIAARKACSGIIAGAMPALRLLAEAISFTALLLFIASSSALAAHTAAGTVISNTAAATFTDGPSSAVPVIDYSNTVSVTTVAGNAPISIEMLKYAPTATNPEMINVAPTAYSPSGSLSGPFLPMPVPTLFGLDTPIDLNSPAPLVKATEYHAGDPIFVLVTAVDQNRDPAVKETLVTTIKDETTGETRVLLMTETGPDTGVFAGYIQSTAQPSPGTLPVADGSLIGATFSDPLTGKTVQAVAVPMIDPYGRVFNSATGELINGAIVNLIDAATGLPATVYGDDGQPTNIFPSVVTTGSTVSDHSGKVYSFPPGEYRFPFLRPGQYRIVVTPPAGYKAPTKASKAQIQQLPGGSYFVLPDNGPWGDVFTVQAGEPAIRIDIPVDPLSKLYVTKTAAADVVAVGDFLQYKFTVENTDKDSPVLAVAASDHLPAGFRYRKGSARINGIAAADPAVSTDGRTLLFTIGDMATGAKAEISYVTEVAAGAVPGTATNTVSAAGTGVSSNTATASVLVKDAFFSNKAFIAGRVFEGCEKPDAPNEGYAGVRLFLENGTYVVTDKNGMYHFEGVKPGSHVVQLDLDSLPEKYEILACEENTRFAGNPWSQFVDLQGGTLWRVDFHINLKPKMKGEVGLELRSVLKKGTDPDRNVIEYSVPVHVGHVPVRNLRLTIMLPDGAVYIPDTSALNAVPRPDPSVMDTVLTYRLGDQPADWEGAVRFSATIPVTGKGGDLTTQAFLNFDTPEARNVRSPVVDNLLGRRIGKIPRKLPDIVLHPHFAKLSADPSEEDKSALDRLIADLKQLNLTHLTVEGHTDSNRIKGKGTLRFKDNYVLSMARATSVGNYLAAGLGLSMDQVTLIGKGPDQPCATNSTAQGRTMNRRVEIEVKTGNELIRAELTNQKDESGRKTVPTTGLRPGEKWVKDRKDDQDETKMPEYTAAWLDSAEPGLAWVWPGEGYHPSIPASNIAIKLDPSRKTTLLVNGEEVDAFFLDTTLKRADNKVALSMWRGVHLIDGDNLFEVVEYDENNVETLRVKRVMHYSGPPVKAELVPAQSSLSADGKTAPVIAIRLIDKDGHPAREGVLGEYTIDPPRLPLQRTEDLQKNLLTASSTERLKYQIGPNGVALIELQPTTTAGDAVVRFSLMNGVQEVHAWLTPEQRDWILVGLAEGSVGYNTIKGRMETAVDSGENNELYKDDKIAFYAKGRIKGEWLLTIAYDSSKKYGNTEQRNLFQTIDPNKYYALYGDATNQGVDAASSRSLYLKIERNQFYALFGDFDTALNITELSRYSRQMNGAKSELKSERADFKIFASENDQAFVKDEIQGDGTSGLYRLSRRNIIINSESVVIETRDRFKSEVVLSSQPLARYLDYSIDYEAGTVWFKSPVFSRDENLNPIFIVVRYELFDTAGGSYNYGGRGAVRVLNNRVEIGATGIHEESNGAGNLEGIDATVKLDEHTTIRAEMATSKSDENGIAKEGSAYLAEVSHRSDKLEGKAYVREEEPGFGLGQQSLSESGMRKTGFDLTYRMNPAYSLTTEMFRQENMTTDAVRDVVQLQGKYSEKRYEVFSGATYAEDSFVDKPTLISEQIFVGGRYQATDRLSVNIRRDQSLAQNSNTDFPTKTTFGADYKLNESATLFAVEELTQGANVDASTTRLGMRASPWKGGQVNSSMEEQTTENGERLFSTLGLKQSWQVTKQWSLDAGLDRAATIRQSQTPTINQNMPPASGSTTDFTAVSLGAGYRGEKWSWTGRGENRVSSDERKFGLFSGVTGELRDGLGIAAGAQVFQSAFASGSKTANDDFRVGLAYRPKESRWIVLDRLDYIVIEQQDGTGTGNLDNKRVVNNFVANYAVPGLGQVSLLNGMKYVRETIDATDYRGYTALLGIEGRYDITKKWDAGLRVLMLDSLTISQVQYGTGLSVGYNIVKNMWISAGYNITGFKDKDFSKADFTAEGPFLKFRLKFDQASARQAVKWFSGL